MAKPVGRPRKQSPRRRGATAREEILDAASELFTRKGFATTSTHDIADAVGMRQASLYYHFPSKRDIFLTLLMGTIQPALALASDLAETDESGSRIKAFLSFPPDVFDADEVDALAQKWLAALAVLAGHRA